MSTLTDKEIKIRGMEYLIANLGLVEAERFIALMNRDGFNYTEWRRDLLADETVEEISRRAMAEHRDSID
ncbi:MAG TPA: hypothetical protein VK918_03515 [Pyrinomonadaceae bacterium]|nr:hypothetical protein [Pyrinomonadaceae bacterium]